MSPTAGWDAVVTSPLFGLGLTLGAYVAARRLWQRLGEHPLANPVLVSILVVGTVLEALDLSYGDYLRGASYVALLLGPATVALGLLLYRERARVRRTAVPVLGGVAAGALAAAAAAYLLMGLLGGSDALALSMAPKSATTPVSIALADEIGGIASLAAVFTILAGILGAIAGPWVLDLLRVRDEAVRGLAVGVASHGIGTARMLHESLTQGAFSGLAMALTALVTAFALPLLLVLL